MRAPDLREADAPRPWLRYEAAGGGGAFFGEGFGREGRGIVEGGDGNVAIGGRCTIAPRSLSDHVDRFATAELLVR